MKLDVLLESLSDTELNAISKEIVSGISLVSIHDQLLGKSNDGDVSFSQKELTNGVINELGKRLLVRDAEAGKLNHNSCSTSTSFGDENEY